MKSLNLIAFFLLLCTTGISQIQSEFDFFLGYGFYEGYNLGGEYNFNRGVNSVSLFTGFNRVKKNSQEYYSAGLGYDFAILRNRVNSPNQFKWSICNRAVFWQLEDNFYLWRAVSLVPSLRRRFALFNKVNFSFDFGPSFNIVLYNKRKTYKEVGWPYHMLPEFRILWIL